jgi:hypothetical protein
VVPLSHQRTFALALLATADGQVVRDTTGR